MASNDNVGGLNAPPPVPPERPSASWRAASSLVMGLTGMVSKGFLYGLNTVEVTGLQRFLNILDERENVDGRTRGLITVCNHVSVVDDPLMWGVIPLRYIFNPSNFRWGLGAHDICFNNKALATFFSLGQVLPTHRLLYSPHGGAFQSTISQAIRLLSSQPFPGSAPLGPSSEVAPSSTSLSEITDPFTSSHLTYTTTGIDSYRAPSAYLSHRHAWVHVFPEGCIHQHPSLSLRYFKWGLARLILESEPLPDVLPMVIDGTQHVMSEERTFPRFLPRIGKTFRVAFGDRLDAEAAFGDLRERWQALVRKETLASSARGGQKTGFASIFGTVQSEGQGEEKQLLAMGELTENLKYGREAVELRVEVARRVRDEIEKLRISLGYPADDPKLGLAETWAKEPPAKEYKSNVDGSLVKKE